MRFAEGALAGKYNNHEVFLGLITAMVSQSDRAEQRTGMQNFTYAPAYDEFVYIVSSLSPRAHKFLSEHFPARSMRNIWCMYKIISVASCTDTCSRLKESRQPCVPMIICEKTFQLVADHLNALSYDGPVCLSCDDTKLLSAFRLYHDSEKKADFLVGAVGGPLFVPNADEIKSIIIRS